MVGHVRLTVAASSALAALAALLIAVAPNVAFGWHSTALHVAIESTATVTAILAAYLLTGRYGVTQSLSDLALVGSLVLLALTSLAFSTIPVLLDAGRTEFTTWGPVLARLLAGVGFVVAAFVPEVRLPSPRRAAAWALAAALAALALVALAVIVLEPHVSAAVGPPVSLSDDPSLHSPASFVVIEALTMVAYLAAAVGFTARAERTHDELTAWFAIAVGLAAAARFHFLLFPAAQPQAVYSGDVVRLAFYVALLTGALREIRHYQRKLALVAVLEERRRLARDLHDGLAQELAFISSQSRRIADDAIGQRLAHAAERALDESRSAIRALTRRAEDPFDVEVARLAEQLTARAGARLRLDVQPDIELPPDRRDQLLRIIREAVTNGLSHGRATVIGVELAAGAGVRLRVRDNGGGFDASGRRSGGGFGLTSMGERAAAMGGRFEVFSRPGEGTVVEVVLP